MLLNGWGSIRQFSTEVSASVCVHRLETVLSLHPQIYNTFPWLMKWLPGAHRTILSQMQHVRDFVDARVQEHKKDFDPTSPRDYIDCFMAEMGDVRPLFRIPVVCRVRFSFFSAFIKMRLDNSALSSLSLTERGPRIWF